MLISKVNEKISTAVRQICTEAVSIIPFSVYFQKEEFKNVIFFIISVIVKKFAIVYINNLRNSCSYASSKMGLYLSRNLCNIDCNSKFTYRFILFFYA